MTSQDIYQTLLTKLEVNWNGLPDKPNETPLSTLSDLWNFVTHSNQISLESDRQLPQLDSGSVELLNNLVERRISGTPLAYIIGHQTYMGVNFLASPEAMIPRKETELLGYTALELAQRLASERSEVHGLDLCTGSGNVALALAHFVPEYEAVAADISKSAIGLAERNARVLGLEKRVKFFTGDLFEPFNCPCYEHSFDLITCNPPYIATANTDKMADEISQFEPREAFDGGPFGINFIRRLIREVPRYLKKASWLVFEVGLGQGESLQRMLEKTSDYQTIGSRTGESGHIRVLVAQSH